MQVFASWGRLTGCKREGKIAGMECKTPGNEQCKKERDQKSSKRGLPYNLSPKGREGGDEGCYLPALSETKNKQRSSRISTAET